MEIMNGICNSSDISAHVNDSLNISDHVNGSLDISDHVDSIQSLPDSFRIIMAIITVIYTLLTLVGNGICIVIFTKSKDYTNSTGYFLLSLAICDLGMVAILPLYTYTMLHGTWPYGTFVCELSAFVRSVLVFNSVWHIFFLTLDTFLAIYKPLTHRRLLDKKVCLSLIISAWVLSTVIFILPFFGVGKYTYLSHNGFCLADSLESVELYYIVFVFLVPVLIAVYGLNGWIWCIAMRSIRDGMPFYKHAVSNHHIQATLKASRTVLIILFFFTFTSTVLVVFHIIQSCQVRIPSTVSVIGSYMGLANHWINIFIYSYINREIRTQVKDILFRCFRYRASNVVHF